MRILVLLLAIALISQESFAQKSKKKNEPQPAATTPPKEKEKNGKSYGEVITKKAITDPGLFKVHKVEAKYYFEIPDSLLTREFLLVPKISGFVENLTFGGAGMGKPESEDYVVRFEKRDKKILLRAVSYGSVADQDLPIYKSVKYNNFDPIIFTFDIQTVSPDSLNSVVEVTDFLTSDVDLINPFQGNMRTQFGIRQHDKSRSLIEGIRSFPENIEMKHVLTYSGTQLPTNQTTGTLSVQMNQSLVLLPKKPMMPRYFDPRVGFITLDVSDYGADEQRTAKRSLITRWRLEPKDMNAWKQGELVEPVKPIVYYIDAATPEKYRKYLKQGIEEWQSAFEKFGFKNAIIAKDAPTPEQDPEWSPEDIRYSVIRYITTDIINAQGPHVHDPRSGEILEADILWYHNVMTWLRSLYTVQTGAYNPKARVPKVSDEDMGLMIRYVCAHEVGHTLGFPHNMASSYAYPTDSLRSPAFTKKWGITPSIMDYARANYVAQPGDGDVHMFNNKIGPYDDYALRWGYCPIPDAKTPDEEVATLQRWIMEKANDKKFRYGRQTVVNHVDPTAQTEDVGDDPVKSGNYGIANLKRVIPNLVAWTSENGKDYTTLQETYNEVLRNWNVMMGHAAQTVGGSYENPQTADTKNWVHDLVPRDKQRAAVQFLNQNCFTTPSYLLNEDLVRRIEYAGVVERLRQHQTNHLNTLFDFSRLARLIEAEAFKGNKAYTIHDLFVDVRDGVWKDLQTGKETDIYKRNLQRAHVGMLENLMINTQPNLPVNLRPVLGFTQVNVKLSDIRLHARAELKWLESSVKRAKALATNATTQAHYDDLLARIDSVLNPK